MFKSSFSRFFSMIGITIGMGTCLLTAAPTAAKADVYVYTDPDYRYMFSVPDSWAMTTPHTPNTRVRFTSPVPDDHAYCEIAAQRDGRFQIYPKRHMGTAVNENFDASFWTDEVGRRFDNPHILHVRYPAGIDKADSSMAQLAYDWPVTERTASAAGHGDEDVIRMRGLILTGVYGDTRYTMTCGARLEKYHRWSKLFGSIVSSVTLDDRYNMFPTGYYRDFLSDKYKKTIPHPGLGTSVRR